MHNIKLLSFCCLLLFTTHVPAQSYVPAPVVDKHNLRRIVKVLSEEIGPRSFDQAKGLEAAEKFIRAEFKSLGYSVQRQRYKVYGTDWVENITVSLGPVNAPRLIIGAHYDTFGEQAGADDNASGIAGLLELARLLKPHESRLKIRIDLVAYTLEEPPFFRTELMGSYIHAKSLHDNKVEVIGMIALEMIGFFSHKENSQRFPIGIMRWFYPDKGNFIAVVSNFSGRKFKSAIAGQMKQVGIPVETLSAPPLLAGVDFSDHMNYQRFGYNAVMVTDTAFYRNPHYHQAGDVIHTLDFVAMSEVIRGLCLAVYNLTVIR
ncbi:MAG: M28 family peptidase [Gammaproteobacteria bacterium]|nr:M28 family peptidase [Gammaproteobacteria bacterium]MDH5652807.1 M28 family peptidase [Gammaproteobacteria bacterium]